MATPPPVWTALPDEKTPRVVGVMNIVFASLLLMCNLLTAGMFALSPWIETQYEAFQKPMRTKIEAGRKSRIDTIKRELAAAPSAEEKAEIQAKLARFEAEPTPQIPSGAAIFTGMKDRRVMAFGIVDVVSGMILNIAMLLGGVGLVVVKEWGRKTAVIVAAIKLVKIAIFTTINCAILVPIQLKALNEQMAPLLAQAKAGPPGNPVAMMMTPQWYAAQTYGTVMVMAIVAAFYSLVVLVMLSKPRVKAACRAAKPLAAERSW